MPFSLIAPTKENLTITQITKNVRKGWVIKTKGGQFVQGDNELMAGERLLFGTIRKDPVFYDTRLDAEKALTYFKNNTTSDLMEAIRSITEEESGQKRYAVIQHHQKIRTKMTEMLGCEALICFAIITEQVVTVTDAEYFVTEPPIA